MRSSPAASVSAWIDGVEHWKSCSLGNQLSIPILDRGRRWVGGGGGGNVVVWGRTGSGALYCFSCFDTLHSEQSYANVDPNK